MKSKFQKILEYSGGDIINKIVLFLMLPIFTKYLLPQEFAIYTNLSIFISFASLFYLFGMHQATFSFFYNKKSAKYIFLLLSTMYIIIIIVGVIFSSLIVLYRDELATIIVKSSVYKFLFIFISLILFFDALVGISLSLLNIMENARKYVILSMVRNSIFLVLLLYGAVSNNFSLGKIFVFMTIASSISLLMAIYIIRNVLRNVSLDPSEKQYFSFDLFKKVLKFGIIILPGTFALLILRVSDRYMLTYLSPNTLHDVGIYAIGYKIGTIIIFVNTITTRICFPHAMKIQHNPQSMEVYRKIYQYYALFAGFVGICIVTFTNEIFSLFIGKAYATATQIVVFAVLSNYLLGIFNIININFYLRQKAKYITIAVVIGAVLNLVINYFLIPKYGIIGASIASVFAYLVIVLYNYSVVYKFYKIKYNLNYQIIGILGILMSTVFIFLPSGEVAIYFVKFFYVLLVLSLLIYFLYKHDELNYIKQRLFANN